MSSTFFLSNKKDDFIIDSSMTLKEAVLNNLNLNCPKEIIADQTLVDVFYYSFDGKLHQGQIVINKRLKKDIEEIFKFSLEIKFPIEKAIPISAESFNWNDDLSMSANNTSGFNYRKIIDTDKLSNHSFGLAIDINPMLNPYFKNGKIYPAEAKYDISESGTLYKNHQFVKKFKELGWQWGGDWIEKDYQHFEKLN